MEPFDLEGRKPSIFGWLRSKETETAALTSDRTEFRSLVDRASDWLDRFRSGLGEETVRSLTTVFRMTRAWLSGDYQDVSKKTLLTIGAALLYCVSPIDVVPDFLLGIGLADDVFVVGWTMKQIADEIQKFRRWERLRTSSEQLETLDRSSVGEVLLCPGWLSEKTDYSELETKFAQIYPNAAVSIFRWESNALWVEARDQIDGDVSDRLVDWIQSRPPESRFVLVGHSLGGRLTIRALAKLAAARREKNRFFSFASSRTATPSHIILMGSAIDRDDSDIATISRTADYSVYNFYNKSDRVLGYLYQSVERKSPLGLEGLPRKTPCFIDVKISGSEEYFWNVVGNAAATVSFFKSKAVLAKIPFSTEFAAQFAEYHQHQFGRYADFLLRCLTGEDESGGRIENAAG